MTPHEFQQWRERNSLSLTTAANALGVSRRTISNYANGQQSIPKFIELACLQIESERNKS